MSDKGFVGCNQQNVVAMETVCLEKNIGKTEN